MGGGRNPGGGGLIPMGGGMPCISGRGGGAIPGGRRGGGTPGGGPETKSNIYQVMHDTRNIGVSNNNQR